MKNNFCEIIMLLLLWFDTEAGKRSKAKHTLGKFAVMSLKVHQVNRL